MRKKITALVVAAIAAGTVSMAGMSHADAATKSNIGTCTRVILCGGGGVHR